MTHRIHETLLNPRGSVDCRVVVQQESGQPVLGIECPNRDQPVPVEDCLTCPAFERVRGRFGHAVSVRCVPSSGKYRR